MTPGGSAGRILLPFPVIFEYLITGKMQGMVCVNAIPEWFFSFYLSW